MSKAELHDVTDETMAAHEAARHVTGTLLDGGGMSLAEAKEEATEADRTKWRGPRSPRPDGARWGRCVCCGECGWIPPMMHVREECFEALEGER